jgi:hypothetical protein
MSTEFQVTFDAADPWELSKFWAATLGYVNPGPPGRELAEGEDPFEAWVEFLTAAGVPESEHHSASAAEDPAGSGPRLFFQRVPEAKSAKNRVHLDVRAAAGLTGEQRMATLEARADELVALGATRLRREEPAPPMSLGYLVMADPEGNEFCLD